MTTNQGKTGAGQALGGTAEGCGLESIRVGEDARRASVERRVLQSEKPPRSDLLPKMADVLGVEIAELLNLNGGRVTVQRSSRPPGKLRKVFEDVSRLPRRQQEHIVQVVSALVMQYEQSRQ